MKTFLLMLTMLSVATSAYAHQCSMGDVSETYMRLGSYYKSQTATSFSVHCDQSYSIRFSSLNLSSANGDSYVSNGNYRLRTRMSITGANANLWNVPLSAQASNQGHKYVVAVQLEDQPSIRVPAGKYRDVIFVNLMF
ncbi:hypothetical protein [Acinetobacter rongchengensis]|uniref:Spore coat protein U domain-containing protein n=1 Tax=Acinetobacter rongchengensis TaxID=2419601 RepID=A0A3A8FFJ4_9GAMM|nr:hypothetical protein [Acinetobacter rongchengensis]RKG39523.1 hypothetical protein D7V20_04855 [Acinetobacter rongchengensis]